MRKVYLFLMLCLFSVAAKAQTAALYSYAASTGTFSSISSTGTVATSGMNADDKTLTGISLGFTFKFGGMGYTTVSACSNGWLSLNNAAGTAYNNSVSSLTAGLVPLIMPWWDDLTGTSGATYYTTTGTTSNHVFTMEWNNWPTRVGTGNGTFQVKLYEATGVVQFVYGSGTYASGSATIGIARTNGTASTADYQTLSGSTTAATSSSTTFTTGVAAHPASGVTYTFTPSPYITVSPASLSFGTVATGTSSTALTSTVTGIYLSTASTTYTATTAAPFQVSADGTTWGTTATITYSSTAGTATNTVYARYQPTISGGSAGTITFTGAGLGSPTPPTIALSGTGAAACTGTPAAGTTAASVTSGCVSFTSVLSLTGAASGAGITFQWQSSPTSGGTYASITGATNNTYTATVTSSAYYQCLVSCTGSGLSASSTPIGITDNPNPTISVSPATAGVCNGVGVGLTASGASSYTWSPATGLSATTGASVTATPTSATTYTVTGTSAAGCTGTASRAVGVGVPFQISALATPSTTCSGGSSTLSTVINNSMYNTVTSITYSPITLTSPTNAVSGDDVSATLSLPFTFNFYGVSYSSIKVCTNGFVNFAASSTTLSNYALPSTSAPLACISLVMHDLNAGTGTGANSITYQSFGTAPNRYFVIYYNAVNNFSGGGTITGQIILYETSNNVDILVGSYSNGTASYNSTIGVQNAAGTAAATPTGRNGVNWTVTTPEAWRFTGVATSGYTYAWTPATGLSSTTSATPTASSITATTIYSVTVTDATTCTQTANDTITIGTLTGTISGSTSVCSGSSSTITFTGPASGTAYYNIDGGTTLSVAIGAGGTATISTGAITSSHTYNLTSIASATCTQTITGQSATVTTTSAPTVSVSPTSGYVCNGTGVALTASGTATSYTWSPATGLSATTGTSVTATPTAATVYTVTGAIGTCTSTATASISIGTPFSLTSAATPSTVCSGGSSTLTASVTPSSLYTNVSSITYSAVTLTSPTSAVSGDDANANIVLPFTFQYYGTNYSSVNVCTNGWISFTSTSTNLSNYALPSTTAPPACVSLVMHDLNAGTGTGTNSITYQSFGTAPNRYFVIYYNTVSNFSGGGSVTGQIILYETTNFIDILVGSYSNGTTTYNNTLGIQNVAGTSALTPSGRNGTAWTVTTPEAWRFAGTVSGVTYAWSPSTALSATTGSTITASSLSTTTVYTVVGTDPATGCTASAKDTVNVGVLPGAITGGGTYCTGTFTSITITGPASGTATYDIDGGSPITVSLDAGGHASVSTGSISAGHTYNLESVTTTGCSQTFTGVSTTITTVTTPTVSVTPTSGGVCGMTGVPLTASGTATSYTWSPATGLSATTGTSVTATPTSATVYTVTGSNAGCSATATASIGVAIATTATATSTPATICAGGAVTLTGSAVYTATYNVGSTTYAPVTLTSPTVAVSGDDANSAIALPFSFNYYGTNYSSINVCTNGWVSFTSTSTNLTNYALPSTTAPPACISIVMHDLNTTTGGTISYQSFGTAPNRYFVIYYNGVANFSGGGSLTGQIILYETTNNIDVLVGSYANGTTVYNSTIGIQNVAGTSATTAPSRNGTAWAVSTPEAWRFSRGTFTYSWSPSTSLSASTGSSVVDSPVTATTTFTLSATDASSGCVTTATTTVTIGSFTGTIGGTTTICSGNTTNIIFTGPAGGTVTYNIGGGADRTLTLDGTGNATLATGPLSATTTYNYTNVALGSCSNSITGAATVTVNPSPSAISGTTIICTGTTSTLTDATTGGTWTSSNTGVATVGSTSGIVTAVSAGTTVISYTTSGCAPATASVTVQATPGAISPATSSICAGTTVALTDGTAGGSWSSSATGVATVNATSGIVTAVSAGTATITYSNGCGTAPTASVTVNTTPVAIMGSGGAAVPAAICTLSTTTLTDSVTGGTWTSSNTAVATVDPSTGIVSSTSSTGSTVITYAIGSCSVSVTLNVGSASPAAITGTTTLCTSATTMLADATASGVWSSSNTSIATVNASSGVVLGVAPGSATITYNNGCGTPATTGVTVNGTAVNITYSSGGLTGPVCTGGTLSLNSGTTAGGTYSWTGPNSFSSTAQNPTIATVTAAASGIYTFSATVGGCSTGNIYSFVAVDGKPNVTASASPATICTGGTAVLTSTVTPVAATVYAIPYSAVTLTSSTAGPSGDDATLSASLGFSFSFNGTPYTAVNICTNGFINFGTASAAYITSALPSTSAPSGMIAAFWHDLNTASGGNITYATVGSAPNRKFVVSYNDVADISGGGVNNGQIILYETSNLIDVMIAKANTAGTYSNNVCGVQNIAGTAAITPPNHNYTNWAVIQPVANGGEGWRFAAPAYNYTWSPSATLATSTAATATSAGLTATQVFTVSATDANSGCTTASTGTATVNVVAQPAITLAATPTSLCSGGSETLVGTPSGGTGTATYTWSGPGLTTFTGTTATPAAFTPTATVTTTGAYSVSLAYTGSGCTTTTASSAAVTINAQPTVTVSSSATSICNGGTQVLTAATTGGSGTATYTWRGPGIATTTSSSPSATFAPTVATTTTGAYSVSVSFIGSGCLPATNVTGIDTVNANPDITVGASPAVCQGVTSANLTYTAATGAPTTYSIVYSTAAHTAGFADVTSATLPASPIVLSVPAAATPATYSGTVTVYNSCASTASHGFNVTVNTTPTASVTSATTPCTGTTATLTLSGTPGATVTYSYNGGTAAHFSLSGAGAYSYVTAPVTATYTFLLSMVDNVSCNTTPGITTTITPVNQVWNGTTSTDWNTASNWACGSVPVATENVLIPSGTTYAPELMSASTGATDTLTINSGAVVTLDSPATLNVAGNLVNNSTVTGGGTVTLNGTAAQKIRGNGYVYNMTLNNTAGATINSSSDTLKVRNTLTLTAGTLTTNNSLMLAADSISTGNIAAIPAGAGISGNLTTMSYLKGKRAYRFWSHPFTSGIPLSQIVRYIDITGAGDTARGFTYTTTDAPSAFWYNPLYANSSTGADPGWRPFTSALGTPDSNLVHQFQGFRLFARGTKGTGLDGVPYVAMPTTVGMYGTVNTGDAAISLKKGTGAHQDYNMVGNPYPSPVDIGAAIYAAGANITGGYYYVWSPFVGTSGGFITKAIDGTSYYLGNNQSFQVRAASSSSVLTFHESNKSAKATEVLLKTDPEYLSLYVYDASYHLFDMAYVKFNDQATDNEDVNIDARKAVNPDLNFYTKSAEGENLTIDQRPYNEQSVIPLGLTTALTQPYIIKVDAANIPAGGSVYLHDKLLQTYTLLQKGTEYKFDITNDGTTQGDRFELSMKQSAAAVVPVNNLNVQMTPNPATDAVNITYTASAKEQTDIRVMTVSGAVVINQNLGAQSGGTISLPVSKLASGVYMVELTHGAGKIVQRLVKD